MYLISRGDHTYIVGEYEALGYLALSLLCILVLSSHYFVNHGIIVTITTWLYVNTVINFSIYSHLGYLRAYILVWMWFSLAVWSVYPARECR